MNTNILHISDLHFVETEKEYYKMKVNGIIDGYIEKNKGKLLDYICVTGDIFNFQITSIISEDSSKADKVIENSVYFFNELKERLLVSKDKNNIMFIPGNHEIVLEYKSYDKLQKMFESNKTNMTMNTDTNENIDINFISDTDFNKNTNMNIVTKNTTFISHKFKIYHDFLERFYCKKMSELQEDFIDFKLKKVKLEDCKPFYFNNYNLILRDEKKKVIFVGLNTLDVDKVNGKNEVIHRINEDDLYNIRHLLRNIPSSKQYKILVLMHTHFFTVEEKERRLYDTSTLVNPDSLFDTLKDYDLQLILHGHKHANLSRRFIISKLQENEKIITVSAVGSSTKENTAYNQFNVIEVCQNDMERDFIFTEFIKRDTCIYKAETSLELPSRKHHFICEIEDMLNTNGTFNKILDIVDINELRLQKLIHILNPFINKIDIIKTEIQKNNNILLYFILPYIIRNNENKINDINNILDEVFKEDFPKEIFFSLSNKSFEKIYGDFEKNIEISQNNKKKYMIYTLLGFYICELYRVLLEDSEKFFNDILRTKITFDIDNIDNNELNEKDIEIIYDEKRHKMVVNIKCKSVNNHKVYMLILKEFELLISKYDKHFIIENIPIYSIEYLIECDGLTESSNYTAFIPTLLPMLTGKNIYRTDEVFSRELIQNSVDAIKDRKHKMKDVDFNGKVEVKISETEFIIEDNGLGMSKSKIDRYFTKIGRSLYTSDEFNNNFNAISNFGIGFLTVFLVADDVTVVTKSYETGDTYKINIPNASGCFFVQKCNEELLNDFGTKIILHFSKEYLDKVKKSNTRLNVDFIEKYLFEYIQRTFYDVGVEIGVEYKENNKLIIDGDFLNVVKKDDKNYYLKIEDDDFNIYFLLEKNRIFLNYKDGLLPRNYRKNLIKGVNVSSVELEQYGIRGSKLFEFILDFKLDLKDVNSPIRLNVSRDRYDFISPELINKVNKSIKTVFDNMITPIEDKLLFTVNTNIDDEAPFILLNYNNKFLWKNIIYLHKGEYIKYVNISKLQDEEQNDFIINLFSNIEKKYNNDSAIKIIFLNYKNAFLSMTKEEQNIDFSIANLLFNCVLDYFDDNNSKEKEKSSKIDVEFRSYIDSVFSQYFHKKQNVQLSFSDNIILLKELLTTCIIDFLRNLNSESYNLNKKYDSNNVKSHCDDIFFFFDENLENILNELFNEIEIKNEPSDVDILAISKKYLMLKIKIRGLDEVIKEKEIQVVAILIFEIMLVISNKLFFVNVPIGFIKELSNGIKMK